MSFYKLYCRHRDFDFEGFLSAVTEKDVRRALAGQNLNAKEFLSLLSPEAENHLETAARRARGLTLQDFGNVVQLYTPMYLSNYCINECSYCAFNLKNEITRRKLTLEEVGKEAEFISSTGLKHVLILTGDSRESAPLSYIKQCVKLLKEYFSSISIEIYALSESEYKELIDEGIDGLTIYQEVYNEKFYDSVHLSGPKKEYLFRLEAPERALRKGIRTANIGALLGLGPWRSEVFFMGLHAKYLQDSFPDAEISVSVPRVRPQVGQFAPAHSVTDKNITQTILALRLFLPRVGITLSTRESAFLRDNLIFLGVTKISAGSTTRVGGHTLAHGETGDSPQFEIYDKRSVKEIKKTLLGKGYQPVLKDW